MKMIRWVPGIVPALTSFGIPATAPKIALGGILGAEITRPSAGLANHPAATVILGVTDHPMADVALGVTQHLAAAVIAGVTTHLAAAVAAAMGAHPAADIVGAIAAHAVHHHPLLVSAGGAGAPAEAFGASAPGAANIQSATGQLIPGNAVGGGVQNNLAAQQHLVGANPVDHHTAGALAHVAGADVAHVAGAVVAHVAGVAVPHVGANPVVAATAVRVDADHITLSVPTQVADLVTLTYIEVGERVPVS